MDGGAWWAAVHGVTEGRTRLSGFTFTFHFHAWRRKWQPTPLFLPGESQGRGSLVGCRLWVAQSQTRLKWLSSSSSRNILLTQPQWVCSFSPIHYLASPFFSDSERFLFGFWAQVCLFVYVSLPLFLFLMEQTGESLYQLKWKAWKNFEMIIHLFVRYLKEISWNSVHDDMEQKFYDYETYIGRWKV